MLQNKKTKSRISTWKTLDAFFMSIGLFSSGLVFVGFFASATSMDSSLGNLVIEYKVELMILVLVSVILSMISLNKWTGHMGRKSTSIDS